MPLATLDLINAVSVRDLTPLQGMKLTEITFPPKSVTRGMDVLRKMKSLVKINREAADVCWKKYDAGDFNK